MDAAVYSELKKAEGATFDTTTDSLEAIRDYDKTIKDETALIKTEADKIAGIVTKLEKPSADAVTDATVAEVVGTKADTVAGTGLISLVKQALAALGIVDGYFDIPTVDVTTNTTVRDVVGNKADAANATASVASIVALIRWLINLVNGMQGGTASLESIKTDLETILDISIIDASFTPTVGAGETVVWEHTLSTIKDAISVLINLTNMIAGDTLIVRQYIKGAVGGSYLLCSDDSANTYTGEQTIKGLIVDVNQIVKDGGKLVIVQSAGTARAFATRVVTAAAGV